jgi:hypothetical protein
MNEITTIAIEDVKTRQHFKVIAGQNVSYITTRDGDRVKLFPVVITTFVKRGAEFDGITVRGNRRLRRL